jgi:hypothetical protein
MKAIGQQFCEQYQCTVMYFIEEGNPRHLFVRYINYKPGSLKEGYPPELPRDAEGYYFKSAIPNDWSEQQAINYLDAAPHIQPTPQAH